jgi:pyroglutamyl-peptidase
MDFSRETGKNRRSAPRGRDAADWVNPDLGGLQGMSGWTVLVTAFEPFGGETVNASWEAARALDGWRCGGAVTVARRLPCVYGACVAEFVEALERLAPEAVLMTGQAARRGVVSVESVARNRAGAATPDNRGVVGAAMTLSGPAMLEATVSANDIARAIRAAGVPARISCDAGDYVCNHLFYGALSCLAEKAQTTPAVFVHLPATPEQTPRSASVRRLATADAALALKAAIAAMMKNAQIERGVGSVALRPDHART